jgi:hypothetical protein
LFGPNPEKIIMTYKEWNKPGIVSDFDGNMRLPSVLLNVKP